MNSEQFRVIQERLININDTLNEILAVLKTISKAMIGEVVERK